MASPTTALCTYCGGEKQLFALVDGIRNGKRFGEQRVIPCPICEGRGYIDPAFAERREEGRRRRDARVARGVSQRDEAARLGVDVVRYSHMEQGRVPFPANTNPLEANDARPETAGN